LIVVLTFRSNTHCGWILLQVFCVYCFLPICFFFLFSLSFSSHAINSEILNCAGFRTEYEAGFILLLLSFVYSIMFLYLYFPTQQNILFFFFLFSFCHYLVFVLLLAFWIIFPFLEGATSNVKLAANSRLTIIISMPFQYFNYNELFWWNLNTRCFDAILSFAFLESGTGKKEKFYTSLNHSNLSNI